MVEFNQVYKKIKKEFDLENIDDSTEFSRLIDYIERESSSLSRTGQRTLFRKVMEHFRGEKYKMIKLETLAVHGTQNYW